MPEALAIFLVLAVSMATYLGAHVAVSRQAARTDVAVVIDELRGRLQWIEDRLALAERENWDPGMIAGLHRQRAEALAQLHTLETRRPINA